MFNILLKWSLYFTVGIVLSLMTQAGFINGWSSPVLLQLSSPNSTIPVTNEEGSWIATIVPLASVVFSPLPVLTMHFLGRKISLLFLTIPAALSWIILACAKTPAHLIIARGIAGISIPYIYVIVPVYLGEISPDNTRGGIGLSMNVIQNIGTLWIYWIGTYPELWISSVSCCVPILLFILFYKWIPESPYFLVQNEREKEAREVLSNLYKSDAESEFIKVESTIKSSTSDMNSFKELFVTAGHRRALFICIGTFMFAQFTGGITFMFFAHTIFQRAGNVSANMMSMIKATIQLVTSIAAAYVVDNVGKKPLLIISCIGSSLFMFCEGFYFYRLDYGYNVDNIWWLPLVSMILFNISQVIGLLPISLSYLGELFHPKVKSVGVCISKATLSLSVFIVGQLFYILTENYGNSVPFFFFAVIGLIGVFFVLFFIPETKGKSLEDIQYYLEHKQYRV